MMDGPSHPLPESDPARANESAPTAADAAVVLQLAEALLLKKAAEQSAARVDPQVMATLVEAIRAIAATKNIPLFGTFEDDLARALGRLLDADVLSGFMRADVEAMRAVVTLANRVLDVCAASQVIGMFWKVEGFQTLDPAFTFREAEAWMRRAVFANQNGDMRFRWTEPSAMVIAHYMARFDNPVAIRLPEGVVARAIYHVDRDAIRGSAKKASGGLVPLTFRCRSLPDNPNAPKPDGRCVAPLPDGAVEASYWHGGKLHRSTSEGPALAIVSAEGRELVALYAEHGAWHRDPAEGPAIFDVNYKMSGLCRAEYWLHGTKHRPSAEGPAVIETDASGRRTLEIYIEHGIRHRDPAEGAAWHGFENGEEIWEYTAHGKLHRADGPAVIARDPQTGAILREEYHVEGELHRDDREGPAYSVRDPELGTLLEQYIWQGEFHRDPSAGPAVIERDAEGRVTAEQFWKDGVFLENRDAPPPNRRARRAAKKRGGKRRRV